MISFLCFSVLMNISFRLHVRFRVLDEVNQREVLMLFFLMDFFVRIC